MLHSTSDCGYAGLPSYSTGTTSTSSALTRKFHIIQPVVVKKNMRSPGCTSIWNLSDLICSRIMLPWQWMMGFGRPVVPDENKIHRGGANGTCSKGNASRETTGPATR